MARSCHYCSRQLRRVWFVIYFLLISVCFFLMALNRVCNSKISEFNLWSLLYNYRLPLSVSVVWTSDTCKDMSLLQFAEKLSVLEIRAMTMCIAVVCRHQMPIRSQKTWLLPQQEKSAATHRELHNGTKFMVAQYPPTKMQGLRTTGPRGPCGKAASHLRTTFLHT